MKSILITGINSYIGRNFDNYINQNFNDYSTDSISVKSDEWIDKDFSKYNILLHVAAIVHKREKKEKELTYFEVNSNLTVKLAKKAKESGVKQFIFMSTMAVYGEQGKLSKEVNITKKTVPNPISLYGKSKLHAEKEIMKLASENFKVTIVRPPMIYGEDCPGNFKSLKKLALLTPIFPMIDNQRSMLNVNKLCYFLEKYIDLNASGIYLPQDEAYVNTSRLVKSIREESGRKMILSKKLGILILFIGKKSSLINKVFGNLTYKKE
ncbi:NAD-dependent epimerase/dehydratase family protein [Bacillus sp. SB49]|uniref:NAD-dependent epimerase/dehydratase family protein n=1 Tax=Bacillus sp. SB49 TaxID=1071080 RepID=UPI00041B9632|nr:NAD-dependent epimerase/dehydratase family protein [Bacillus sp. SB49]QHT48026.1 NAD-dependent epimerase/dehydratase family protein [Bacillus sp. SB49]